MRAAGVRGSFWPTETQEALIRVAIGPSADAAAGWEELRPRIDLQTLDDGSFCVMPLLFERLSEVAPDDDQLSLLQGIYRSVWYRNQMLLERLRDLLPPLREAGVEPLLVGGAAVAQRWYPKLGSRPVALLELLVGPGDGDAVRDAATSSGWRPAGRRVGYRRYVDDVSRVLFVYEGAPAEVAGPLGAAGGREALLGTSQELDVLGETVRGLAPADELLFVCGLAARTRLPPNAQWLLDVERLVASDTGPEPAETVARARLFHLVEPLRDAVSYLARIRGGERQARWERELASSSSRPRDAVAYRLAGARIGRLGGLPGTVALHLQETSEQPVWRAVATLPAGVARQWQAERVAELPALALRKLRRQRAAAAARKRSASSTGS